MRDKKLDTQEVDYIDLMNNAKSQEGKEKYRKMNLDVKKQQVADHKLNYLNYFDDKMKQDYNQVQVTQTFDVDVSNKLPKRPKNKSTDSIEQITNNMQVLIKFSKNKHKQLNKIYSKKLSAK